MQGFYADAAAAELPFATPEIFRVETADGMPVTYERKLPGERLQNRVGIETLTDEPQPNRQTPSREHESGPKYAAKVAGAAANGLPRVTRSIEVADEKIA